MFGFSIDVAVATAAAAAFHSREKRRSDSAKIIRRRTARFGLMKLELSLGAGADRSVHIRPKGRHEGSCCVHAPLCILGQLIPMHAQVSDNTQRNQFQFQMNRIET